MSDKLLQQLEAKLDELIRVCARLEKDNAELRQQKEEWNQERARLIEKNSLARQRVEAMIANLKKIEAET